MTDHLLEARGLELVTSGYCFESAAEAGSVAIPADHPALSGWGSHGAVVVGGSAELGEDGTVHDSAALVDASGVRAVYRKTHLWDRESLFFTPGTIRLRSSTRRSAASA